MQAYDEWELPRGERSSYLHAAGMSAVRVALLFGSIAVALALIAAPIADREARALVQRTDGIDNVHTGSINRGGSYTIRKSVLQPSPYSICVIREGGERIGDC
jgi:hypothetical protein